MSRCNTSFTIRQKEQMANKINVIIAKTQTAVGLDQQDDVCL
jgi:hypothetical protein